MKNNMQETPKALLDVHETTSDYLYSFEFQEVGSPDNMELDLSPEFKKVFKQTILDISLNKDLKSLKENNEEFLQSKQWIACSWQKIYQLIGNVLESTIFYWINTVFLIAFLISCFMYDPVNLPNLKESSELIQLNCQVYFCFVILLRLINRQSQFIVWTILQIIITAAGLSAMIVPEHVVKYLKAVRALRILYFSQVMPCLSYAGRNLVYSLSNAKKIIFPAAVFIYIFAIIGIFSFSDYQYNRCRTPDNKFKSQNWTVYEKQIFLCGQKKCPIENDVQLQCLNPIDYGVQPNPQQLLKIELGYGLLQYSNVLSALLSTYKQIFITGSSRLMVLYKQATYQIYIYFYFLSFIYLLSYVYLNIFFGLMLANQTSKVSTKLIETSYDLNEEPASLEIKPLTQPTPSLKPLSQQERSNHNQDQALNFQVTVNNNSQKKFSRKMKLSPIPQHINSKSNSKNYLSPFDQNINFEPPLNFSETQIIDDQDKCEYFFDGKPLEPALINKKTKKAQKAQKISNIDFSKIDDIQKQFQQLQSDSIAGQNQNISQGSKKLQDCFKILVYISNIFIIIGCINICIDFKNQSQHFRIILDTIDFIYYCIFMLDLIVKIVMYYKIQEQFQKNKKKQIVIEIFIAVVCTGGVIYQGSIATCLKDFLIAQSITEKMIRSLKYLRILSYILRTPNIHQPKIILCSVIQVIKKIKSLIAFYIYIVIVFSMVGFHLFGYTTKVNQYGQFDLQNGKSFDVSFDGIYNSSVFIFLTFYNQQWDFWMFQQFLGNSYVIVIWQLISITFGYTILSKFFMTLLMKQLSDKLDEERQQFKPQSSQELQDIIQFQNLFLNDDYDLNQQTQSQQGKQQLSINAKILPISEGKPRASKRASFFQILEQKKKFGSTAEIAFFQQKNQKQHQKLNNFLQVQKNTIKKVQISFQESSIDNIHQKYKCTTILKKSSYENQDDDSPNFLEIFQSKITQFFRAIIKSKYLIFIHSILLVLQCAGLIIDTPHIQPDSIQQIVVSIINYITQIYFVAEILLTMFAFGLWRDKNSYFRRSWLNGLYLSLSIVGIIGLTPLKYNAFFAKITKIKVLRVLRFLQLRYDNSKSMRLTVVGFTKLIPKIFSLFFVALVIFGYFAVIMVKLYKDDFNYCINTPSNEIILNKTDCLNWGGDWIQHQINAQNFGSAILYLFLVSATQGWSSIILPVTGLRGPDLQPISNSNPGILVFFIIFFFIGNLIIINVFMGLTIYNFKKIKEQTTGQSKLLPNEKMWLTIKLQIYRLEPQVLDKQPQFVIRKYSHKIAKSFCYKIYKGIVFVLYLIIMSLITSNMNKTTNTITISLIKGLIILIVPEYLIQVLAYGIRKDHKVKFFIQTILVIYSFLVISFTDIFNVQQKLKRVLVGILIFCQFFRYFTVLNEIPFVRKLLNSLITIIPQTTNIFMIMIATLFIYSIIGMQFFAFLRPSTELNQFDQNYKTFSSSLFALIKFSLWESPINQIMDAGHQIGPNFVCFDILSYEDFATYGQMGCGNKIQSYIFFLTFHLIYSLILMPTMMAIIFDSYSQVIRQQQSLVNKFQLQDIKQLWKNYDTQATGYISYRDFWMFTAQLMKIYKVDHKMIINQSKQSFLKNLAIPIYENDNGVLCFQFHEVIQGLTKIVIKKKKGKSFVTAKADKIMKQRQSLASDKLKRSDYNSSHVLTLIILKSGLRVWNKKSHQKNVLTIFSNIKLLNKEKSIIINNPANRNNSN